MHTVSIPTLDDEAARAMTRRDIYTRFFIVMEDRYYLFGIVIRHEINID
jgi:hypothetical protein